MTLDADTLLTLLVLVIAACGLPLGWSSERPRNPRRYLGGRG